MGKGKEKGGKGKGKLKRGKGKRGKEERGKGERVKGERGKGTLILIMFLLTDFSLVHSTTLYIHRKAKLYSITDD